NIRGRFDLVAVKRIVVLAIVELLPDAPADLEVQVGSYGHIAGVEQAMNVPPQQESIGGLVRAAIGIGAYMRSLQGWQRPLLGDRAAPPVDIRDKHPECSLPEAGTYKVRLAKARGLLGHTRNLRPVQAVGDGFPQRQSLGIARIVS